MTKHGKLWLHEVAVKWNHGIVRIVATCEACGEDVQIGANGLPVEDTECRGNGHAIPVTVYEPDEHGGPLAESDTMNSFDGTMI